MTHKRFLIGFILIWMLLFPGFSNAQGYKISGRIVDSETLEPLPYTHVFIDQTTIGTISDFNGEYVIENVSNGEYKLVYSFVGYELFYNVVSINGKDVRASARLVPQKSELQNVEVKGTRDKEWESQLRKFEKVFFGDNDLADGCKILNPWVLDFTYDKGKNVFKAAASAPLEIENRSLGYSIVCSLIGFSFDKTSYKIKGLYKFKELNTTDTKEALRWTRNRRQAYQNSMRFLMKSIVENHANENGFDIYLDNRPLIYTSSSGLFSDELQKDNVKQLAVTDWVTPTGRPGFYKLSLDKRIEIHHTTQFARSKVYRDLPYPVSWIEVEKGYLIVSENGVVVDNDNVVTSGELNNNRVSTMLPLDYSPGSFVVVNYLTKRNVAMRLQERIFLQTDKNIYHQGERIWFKAYKNYANQSVRDSLSQVLYVELLDGESKIVQSKIVKLDGAGGSGNFKISDTSASGNYYLRGYTSWMQNYGVSVIQYVPIIVADSKTKLIHAESKDNQTAGDFVWEVSVQNDSISLQLMIDSTLYQGLANCAISISPAESVFDNPARIKNAFFFDSDLPDGSLPDFIYPVEYGFSIKGRLRHPRKEFVQGRVTAIQGRMDSLYSFKTDNKGYFTIDELDFYDTVTFSFQSKNRKGKIIAQTELLPRRIPPVLYGKSTAPKLDTILLSNPIQLKKPTLANTDAVIVLEASEEETKTSLFTDYLLTSSDLERMPPGQSILLALQGRVPGLQYDYVRKSLIFRSNKLGANEDNEPLLVIDGVPMFAAPNIKTSANDVGEQVQTQQNSGPDNTQGSPDRQALIPNQSWSQSKVQVEQNQTLSSSSDLLNNLSVSSVSRVEISSRVDPRYGSLASNGVIAIYTKKEQSRGADINPFNIFQVEGFSTPQPFTRAINYSGNPSHEYTPTWYWNPELQVSSNKPTTIKFDALPKGVVFRVSIAGISKSGVPLSGTFLINGSSAKPVSANLDQRQK